MPARVASASETVACELATIATGVTARDLMRRAGYAAAEVILARYPPDRSPGVSIVAGSGNNGGDGWVVAGALATSGYRVRMIEARAPRSADALEAREQAVRVAADAAGAIELTENIGASTVVVDALLGTGSTGAPHGTIAAMIAAIDAARAAGAKVVSLDVPSGLDATTGSSEGAVTADMTIALGTLKRGLLHSREICGEIFVLDIGLIEGEAMNALPILIDSEWARSRIPPIPRAAHKGTRKRLSVIGGGRGMAGAAILAGRGALRSGIGLLQLIVDRDNIAAIHSAVPEALAAGWPDDASGVASLVRGSDTVAIGPGLGSSARTRELVERLLLDYAGPVVVDADALNVFENDTASLAALLNGRQSILTPHPAELGRLLGIGTTDVLDQRFEVATGMSRQLGAAVLLKGTPTIVFAANGERYVVASGTAALATGGSGDVLTGICATLLGQSGDAGVAAACAAFIHGRAAELCEGVRGVTLDDILLAMPAAWNEAPPRALPGHHARLEASS